MIMPEFEPGAPVAVIGTGVMGAKVAWASARAGVETRMYDASEAASAAALERALTWSEGDERDRVVANLRPSATLESALEGVQLAFENVPEDLELKRAVLADLGARLRPEAYLGSNTSSLRCTPLAEASGRPERFFNLNWSDPRSMRLVELMGSPRTAPATLDFAEAWARRLGMVPVRTRVEQMGYSFNRIWRVVKKEVLRQIAEGIADPEDIDRAWMLAFGTACGPCGLMDRVSIPSVRNIELAYYHDSGDASDRPPEYLDRMIAEGRLGQSAGKGFYTYPHPAYEDPDWLSATPSREPE